MTADASKLVERLHNAAAHVEQTRDADSDKLDCTFLPFTSASMRVMLNEAAAALAEARANHEGALKASMYWHDLYRKECRLRQDDAARYGQQLEDAESELAALRAAVADVMAVPELHDMGCIGSMAPAEHALGVLRHFHTAALAPLPAAPSGATPEARGDGRLWQRIVERWDFAVYRMAYRSLDRMMRRGDGGFAYLFELQLRAWREANPLPAQLASATERFHESLTTPDSAQGGSDE